MTGIETLLADAEHLVESELPSTNDVRKILAAIVKRLEQGFLDTTTPPEPTQAAPTPTPAVPPPPAADQSEVLAAIQAIATQVSTLTSDVQALQAAEAPDAPAPPATTTPAPIVPAPVVPVTPAPDAPATDAPTS